MIQKAGSLRALLQKEKGVLAPCMFDAASARVVELAGFPAMCLSSAELSMGMNGVPDLGTLNLSELEWVVSRIAANNSVPLIVDIEAGFGGPMNVYRTCKTQANAGAKALLMEDEREPGFARGVVESNMIPREEYLVNVKTAKAALEGMDCMLIARTNTDISVGLDEAVARCLGSIEAGADMTLVNRLSTMEQARAVAARVPGWKMFPDLNQAAGQEDINPHELFALGYNIVTMHFMMKAAMVGMLDYALRVAKEQNNLCTRDDVRYGVSGQSGQPFFAVQEWLDFEGEFTGVKRRFWGDKLNLNK